MMHRSMQFALTVWDNAQSDSHYCEYKARQKDYDPT